MEVAMGSTLIGKQAVVIGAGMGGLTAAGALQQVTLDMAWPTTDL